MSLRPRNPCGGRSGLRSSERRRGRVHSQDTDVRTTQRYVTIFDEEKRRAMEDFDIGGSPPRDERGDAGGRLGYRRGMVIRLQQPARTRVLSVPYHERSLYTSSCSQ